MKDKQIKRKFYNILSKWSKEKKEEACLHESCGNSDTEARGREKEKSMFNSAYYLAKYPDVKASKMNAWEHYDKYGRSERRFPNKRAELLADPAMTEVVINGKAVLVDERYYYIKYPDVKNAGMPASEHFTRFGYKEGRFPNALVEFRGDFVSYEELFELFDEKFYAARYPDVRRSNAEPWEHYLQIGIKEGRNINEEDEIKLIQFKVEKEANYEPLVSIIVPNYNHAPYLKTRLDSIYRQTYQNYEVILMDDCSSDESQDILREYSNRYPDKTKLLLNEKNSGSPYVQWRKGMSEAKGELIWIAESDDYCDLDFIETHVRNFMESSVMLSFSYSCFIKNGKKVSGTEMNLADCIPSSTWATPFVTTAHLFVNNCLGAKNAIINVSSCIFRKIDFSITDISHWYDYKLCGDWIFYLSLIAGGRIAYTNKSLNYYRLHDKSTSLSVQKQLDYYREHEKVAIYVAENYRVCPDAHIRNYLSRLRHFENLQKNADISLSDCFNIANVKQAFERRKPNILMCTNALVSGGGETFPIYLANGLKSRNYPVTLLDMHNLPENTSVRQKILPNVPLVRRRKLRASLATIIEDFGIDIVHSHHLNVDMSIADIRRKNNLFKHIVTQHGMYELEKETTFNSKVLPMLFTVDHWVYIAEKNLNLFRKQGLFSPINFEKIYNAVPYEKQTKTAEELRKALGIREDSFVVVMASRAVPQKGWTEAIEAVRLVRAENKSDVRLVLIGEGPEYDRLCVNTPDYVQLLGYKSDVVNWLHMGNVTLVASTFAGECVPLVILESYNAGSPVIATDIGEISNMLHVDSCEAGVLIELRDGEIPIEHLAYVISRLANDEAYYKKLKSNVPFMANYFSFDVMLDKYTEVYSKHYRSV